MAEEGTSSPADFNQYLPGRGLIHNDDVPQLILCKPKLMPLKSVTLEKLEKMQQDAEKKLKEQKEESN